MKLFADHLPFLKGNFHTHTTLSDGERTPAEAMAMYRAAGYDVLALTDHRGLTIPDPADIPEGLLLVPGIELDFLLPPSQAVHLVGLGVREEIVRAWDPAGTPQEAVDAMRRCGGEVFLAHPAWSMNTPTFIASLQGLIGVEVWNSVSTLPYNGDRSNASSILDVTFASTGRLLPLFANDDTHFYGQDFAAAATMVQARERSVPAVLEALREGRFYATQGPRIHQIELTDGVCRVDCSAAETVVFYSAMPWAKGRVAHIHGGTHAEYTSTARDGFLRVQVIDQDGKSAWSAPVRV